MDLLLKTVIYAVILIAILFVVYYLSQHTFNQKLTESGAEAIIQQDLQQEYPGAQVSMLNVTPSQYPGSWHMTAAVVLNSTSPCPTYYIYTYDYPQYSFQYGLQNTYTENCVINSTSLVTSYPVAIAKSYALNISSVRGYVSKYGFHNVIVHAAYYNQTRFNSVNFTKVWLVNYTAPSANLSSIAIINQNGVLEAAANVSH